MRQEVAEDFFRETDHPNGLYQEQENWKCAAIFEIAPSQYNLSAWNHVCNDKTCDKTADGVQTRCSLDTYAKNNFLKKAGITSSGQICTPGYSAGTPHNSHAQQTKIDAWWRCPHCCNYCDTTVAKGIKLFQENVTWSCSM